ncbi:MAG: FkbM family methyltransferase [Deltaproteobacteria bacterium]|nr:FkbM family methyltransferase [Deltaproteobacteria bacterium]
MNRYVAHIIKKIIYYKRRIFRPKVIKNYGVKINTGEHISKNIMNFIYWGAYEGEEVAILSKVLKPTDKVLEIGSGLGFLTIFCAKQIGSENVVAYEANPLLVDKIKENFSLNNVNPDIRNAVLDDIESEVDFFVEDSFWSSSTVRRSDEAKVIKVKTRDINDTLLDTQPNFIIMDIEGGEKELIYKINFDSIDKLLIEIHPHVIGNTQATSIIAYLFEKGFELDFALSKGNVFYFTKSLEIEK